MVVSATPAVDAAPARWVVEPIDGFRASLPPDRASPGSDKPFPLVLEPARARSLEWLLRAVRAEAEALTNALTRHGAILLRGFDVGSEADFEQVLLAFPTLRPVGEIFLSEPGRELVAGTRYVFYTNKKVRTGGGLDLGFHTENFYLPDLPHYVTFYCRVPPPQGGETALLSMVDLYDSLGDDLRRRVEARAFEVARFPLEPIAERYGVPVPVLVASLEDKGLHVARSDAGSHLVVHKPAVVVHPSTRRKALVVNMSELGDTSRAVLLRYARDLTGWRWAPHRYVWSSPKVEFVIDNWKYLAEPVTVVRFFASELATRLRGAAKVEEPPDPNRLWSAFSAEDGAAVVDATYRGFSSVPWKRGDIMIIDNLQLAHSGMPGRGRRVVRASMANPLLLDCRPGAPGVQEIASAEPDSLAASLRRFARERAPRAPGER